MDPRRDAYLETRTDPPATSVTELKQKYLGDNATATTLPHRSHPLSSEEEEMVQTILSRRGSGSHLLSQHGISTQEIRALRPKAWLNDSVIDVYGEMIQERSRKQEIANLLDVHYFRTFFWTMLKKNGYHGGRLARWTKNVSGVIDDTACIHVYPSRLICSKKT